MNFQIKPYYIIFGATLILSSCSQYEDIMSVDSDDISFVADMPGVTTRTIYDVPERMGKHGFTVSTISPENDPDAKGNLKYHCQNIVLKRQADGVFRADSCRWPGNEWPKIGSLKFFAFHPPISVMNERGGFGNEYFKYENSTTKNGDEINYDYRLTKFRVIQDISKQVDFVAAIGEGNKTADLYRSIKLDFEHQLCAVEIGAWGGSSLYDIEIAGVRIGGTVVEADFDMSAVTDNPAENITWHITSKSPRGYVDYVFAPDDKVVKINAKEHNTKEKVASIMGGGGKAMLIPYRHDKWDYKADRENKANGMYFSALVRITQHEGDHHCIYPSTDPQSQDYIVYLSVLKSDGTVKQRLDKKGNIYGTSTPYKKPDTEEIRTYGWAAAPANVDWKAGYSYSYVLDYSNGVGVHDPCDLNPGAPMIDWGGVEITTATGEWNSGSIITEGSWGANSNNTAPDGTVWWK